MRKISAECPPRSSHENPSYNCFIALHRASSSHRATTHSHQPSAGDGSNERLVTIEESTGTMRLYEPNKGTGSQAMKQLLPSNFLIDLDRIKNIRQVKNPNRVDRREDPEFVFWPMARTGSGQTGRGRQSNVPAYGEMYNLFLPREKIAVLNSEDLFFR